MSNHPPRIASQLYCWVVAKEGAHVELVEDSLVLYPRPAAPLLPTFPSKRDAERDWVPDLIACYPAIAP